MTFFVRKKLYLFFYPLVIAEEILRRSHYCDFAIFKYLCFAALVISCLFAALKLGLDIYQRKISNRNILIICVGFLYCTFLLLRKQTDAFMVLWLFIAAGHDVDYGSQLKAAAFSMIAAVAFVIVSGLLGIINNTSVVRTRDEIEYTRNGLGFREAYQAAYFLFFAILGWIGYRKEKISWFELVSVFLLSYWGFVMCDTRGPFYLTILVVAGVVTLKMLRENLHYQSVYTVIAAIAPIICAGLIIFQGAIIDPNSSEFLRDVNMKISGRLQFNFDAVKQYGISFFGTTVNWYIGDEKAWNPYRSYNWVDSAYLYSLISYGIPFLAGFLAFSLKLAIDAGKKKDAYMLLALIAIALLGLWDNYCFRVECNPFFLFLAYEAYQPEKFVHHECLNIGGSHEIP